MTILVNDYFKNCEQKPKIRFTFTRSILGRPPFNSSPCHDTLCPSRVMTTVRITQRKAAHHDDTNDPGRDEDTEVLIKYQVHTNESEVPPHQAMHRLMIRFTFSLSTTFQTRSSFFSQLFLPVRKHISVKQNLQESQDVLPRPRRLGLSRRR